MTNLSLVNSMQYEKRFSEFFESSNESYFQQSPQWKNVIESFGKDKWVCPMVLENKKVIGVIPLYLYKSKLGNIINSVPYPGPLGGVIINSDSKTKKEKIFKLLMHQVDKISTQFDVVTTTIISSPFWPDDNLYRKHWRPNYELENYTLYIDLTKPQKTKSKFRNNLRRMLSKAESSKLKVAESSKITDLNSWYKIHQKRHLEIGVDPIHKQVFSESLNHLIPTSKGKFLYVKDDKNKIVAGCFVASHNQVVDTYMISGNSHIHQNGAIYLLIDHLLNWSKNSGFKYFNWQSSKPRGSGPYKFKMQWGSKEAPYYFFTKTYQPIDKFLGAGLDKIKKEYKWHFVLPFNLLDK